MSIEVCFGRSCWGTRRLVGIILRGLGAATRKQAASSKVSLTAALGAWVCVETLSYICDVMWGMYEGGRELNEYHATERMRCPIPHTLLFFSVDRFLR